MKIRTWVSEGKDRRLQSSDTHRLLRPGEAGPRAAELWGRGEQEPEGRLEQLETNLAAALPIL